MHFAAIAGAFKLRAHPVVDNFDLLLRHSQETHDLSFGKLGHGNNLSGRLCRAAHCEPKTKAFRGSKKLGMPLEGNIVDRDNLWSDPEKRPRVLIMKQVRAEPPQLPGKIDSQAQQRVLGDLISSEIGRAAFPHSSGLFPTEEEKILVASI